MSAIKKELETLCRALGDPARDWVLLAEGNAAARDGEDALLVTASGSMLSDGTLVRADLGGVLDALDGAAGDADWACRLGEACGGPSKSRPTVEIGLHAVAAAVGGALFVGHTHPTSVNAVLCSSRAAAIAEGAVFPDQVVICGPHPLVLPYVDPGLALARAFDEALRAHMERHGEAPKVVYLQSHGLIALGSSALEVAQITGMADKAARVLLGALSVGGARFLSEADVERIDSRADEAHRRAMLAVGQLEPGT